MKREILNIGWALAATAALSSCDSFLEESPKTFLSPKYYFQTENQITAGVNGLYTFVDDIFDGDIEVGTQNFIFLDYLPGYGIRPRAASSLYLSQALNLSVTEESTHVENLWKSSYFAIENCNGVIAGIEAAKNVEIAEDTRNKLLGEAYFLRAYNYFNLVRLYGPVPLKTKTTSDLSQAQLPLSSEEAIYEVIVTDLTQAEKLMENAPWTSTDGRVTKGAVKSMLAKVYLTMAGYPLQKGGEYYRMAYEKAHEVYESGQFRLFDTYAEMRDPANANSGEFIWMIQREADRAGSPVHNDMLPYPEPSKAISQNGAYGGALAPAQAFYESYPAGDLRTAEKGYYYTEHEAQDGSGVTVLDLMDAIEPNLENAELRFQLADMISKTLGSDFEKACEYYFDYALACDTYQKYNCKDIPSLDNSSIPAEISDIHYDCDLSKVTPLGVPSEIFPNSKLIKSL